MFLLAEKTKYAELVKLCVVCAIMQKSIFYSTVLYIAQSML